MEIVVGIVWGGKMIASGNEALGQQTMEKMRLCKLIFHRHKFFSPRLLSATMTYHGKDASSICLAVEQSILHCPKPPTPPSFP